MLTVLMATHNGEGTLPRVLESYLNLQAPPGGWKVVIVANACTDNTCGIVRGYGHRLPIFLVERPERGKNLALNTGLEHVNGDLVVLTDDDAVPQPDWLVEMRRGADHNPAFDVFGGRIDALWPSEPPEWFSGVVPLGITYAITPDTVKGGPISPGVVWGPNMAVRRSVFDAGYRFDISVGPKEGQYRMGSETEFTTRVAEYGHRSLHLAASRVSHIIRPYQMEKKWILRRAYRFGRDICNKKKGRDSLPVLFAVPRWMIRNALQKVLRLVVSTLSGDFQRTFSAQWELQYFLGYWHEARASQRYPGKAWRRT